MSSVQTSEQSSLRTFGFAALLAVVTVVVYLNSFDGVFVLDDVNHIVDRPAIRTLSPDLLAGSRRPLVALSLAVNYRLGETDPFGYHLFNLAVHTAAALVLFGLARRVIRLVDPQRDATLPALLIAMLWAVHPLQTESVTYVIQRSESMMGLCMLLTLYAFVRAQQVARSWPWYLLSVMACAAGMGCKAVMIAAPPIVLLLDLCLVERSLPRVAARRWWYYAALGATTLVIVATGVAGAVLDPTPDATAAAGFSYKGITPLTYALTQPGVVLHYLRLTIWPHPLCLDYQWPPAGGVIDAIVPTLILLATIVALFWLLRGQRPLLIFLLGATALALGPTSSIVPIKDPAFEHRMYVPLAFVIAIGLMLGASGLRAAGVAVIGRLGLVAVIAVALGATTAVRNADYHSSIAMWADVLATRPSNARAHNQYGNALRIAGRRDEALAAYRRAAELEPNMMAAHANIAGMLESAGDLDGAIDAYREAARAANDPRVLLRLANTLIRAERMSDAMQPLDIASETRKVELLLQIGHAYFTAGSPTDALLTFDRAAELAPQRPEPHFYRGETLGTMGRIAEAEAAFQRVLELVPDHAAARRYVDEIRAARQSG